MAIRSITELPIELLVIVLLALGAQDLSICKRVCRLFLDLIQTSVPLQYHYELEIAGMTNESACPLPCAEKLRKLRALQRLRRNAQLVRGRSILDHETSAYAATPSGLFAQGLDDGSIQFLQFPSKVFGMEEREWTVNGSKINMQEIDALSVDPAQDFLVVIGTPLAPHVPGAEELVLRFLSLSDCQPHPLAQRNNCSFETDFCSRCYVEGDLVGHDATLPAEMTILVWNWKTGDLLWRLQQADGRGYDTFSFVDDRLILALRAQGHEVDIFELDPSNERMCFPTVMYGARCTFTLPQRVYADLDSTAWPFIGTHYMSGLSRRDPSRPFYPSARRDLVVHFSTCMASSTTSAMLVPVHAIRSWVREAKNGSIGDDDQNMDSDEDDTGDDVEYKYADHDVNNAEAEADVRWPLWITRYPRVLGRGPPCCAEVQGMHATIANIENAEGDGYELRVTFLDYTAVGGKSFDFTAKNLTAWRHGDLGDLPLYSEGVHTALVRADDILVYDAPRRGDVVVIPDYALLQQCKVDGRYRWQIYYITSPDSDEDDVRLT